MQYSFQQIPKLLLGRCIWDRRVVDECLELGLSSQHFWDDMDRSLFETLVKAHREVINDTQILYVVSESMSGDALEHFKSCEAATSNGLIHDVKIKFLVSELMAGSWKLRFTTDLSRVSSDIFHAENREQVNAFKVRFAKVYQDLIEDDFMMLSDPVTVSDYFPEYFKNLEAKMIQRRAGNTVGILTGYKFLDNALGGWIDSCLYVVAGRPGKGKTALACGFAAEAIRQSKHTLFISMEMGRDRIIDRVLSYETSLFSSKLKDGALSEQELDILVQACRSNMFSYLHVENIVSADISDIEKIARRMRRRGKIDLFIVDYLQLVRSSGFSKQSRYAEVTNVSNRIKGLTIELNIPIIALAQLSRDLEKNSVRQSQEASNANLKDSGSIEQDADAIIQIHEFEEKHSIQVTKNRDGSELVKFVYPRLAENRFDEHYYA